MYWERNIWLKTTDTKEEEYKLLIYGSITVFFPATPVPVCMTGCGAEYTLLFSVECMCSANIVYRVVCRFPDSTTLSSQTYSDLGKG